MSDFLAPVGVTAYNGVTFGARHETKAVEIKPILDSARRTVIHNVYSLTIDTDVYLSGGATPTDASMQALRKQLTAIGGQLSYTSKGLGTDLIINNQAGGGIRDVKWGPIPEMLNWKPQGSNIYARMLWKISWAIMDCPNPLQQQLGVMEFCYSVHYDIDKSGYTTRTYTGHLTIPQSKATVNSRSLTATADQFLEKIAQLIPNGFRRIMGPRDLDEAKCRLNWSIRDEEMPRNIPPPSVIEVSADHAVSSMTLPGPGTKWNATLSASYEMAKDTSPTVAFQYFRNLLADRFEQAKQYTGPSVKEGIPILRSFGMRESIYDRSKAAFNAAWTYIGPLQNILLSSGLWRPPPDSDWTAWYMSLKNTAFHVRGNAKMQFLPSDDALIDLCTNQAPPTVSTLTTRLPQKTNSLKTISNAVPDPAFSWYTYDSSLKLETIDDVTELRTLPLGLPLNNNPPTGNAPAAVPTTIKTFPPSQNPPSAKNTDSIDITDDNFGLGSKVSVPSGGIVGSLVNSSDGGLSYPSKNYSPLAIYASLNNQQTTTMQIRNTPRVRAILSGWAIRAGWGIVPPVLLNIGGVNAVLANEEGDGFEQKIWTTWLGLPMILGRWRLRYILPGVPVGRLPIPNGPYPLGT